MVIGRDSAFSNKRYKTRTEQRYVFFKELHIPVINVEKRLLLDVDAIWKSDQGFGYE